jgi:hypothetical protein
MMHPPADWMAEMHDLLEVLLSDEPFSESDRLRLNALLANGKEQRAYFITYMDVHSCLAWNGVQESRHWNDEIVGMTDQSTHNVPLPPMPLAQAICNAPLEIPSTPLHHVAGYLSSGWPMAYLVATVTTILGLLLCANLQISPMAARIGPNAAQHATSVDAKKSPSLTVASITDMADCQWAEPKRVPLGNTRISCGQEFAINSGLIEITYDTGAKVILQGPVTYGVESDNGGYLAIGKMTGKVTTKSAAGFTVRTPTAIVTDLGTEFGVEVAKDGVTTSRVYRGVVRMSALGNGGTVEDVAHTLREDQVGRVASDGNNRKIIIVPSSASSDFIRAVPKRAIKLFDLVDVVAGGNGFSNHRGRGIDPLTGRAVAAEPEDHEMRGDYRFRRVEDMEFIDGVFIPDGSKGPVQIDSANHVFPDCPVTDNRSWAKIWAGGKLPATMTMMPTVLAGVDYSLPEHSLLAIHANKGITFNLDAIRRANPGYELRCFRAVTGNTEDHSQMNETVYADIWVLVDGQVRFKRREMTSYSGAAYIAIPISANDRYLTLATTDGGNTFRCDQIIFGDPRLELVGTTKSDDNTPQVVPH